MLREIYCDKFHQKQIVFNPVIIALDKQDSYSEKTSLLLSKSAVLRLTSNGQELFGRSWG